MAETKCSKLYDRVDEILGSPMTVEKKKNVPMSAATAYNKAYEVRLGAIFVDMRDSASRFSGTNRALVAKIAKTFDGTVLRMLRADNCVELGVRGNTVFALYSAPEDSDMEDLIRIVARTSSAIRLLNILYSGKNIDPVYAGIGMSVSSGLVMKARCKLLGDRDRIWIADSISEASELAKLGGVLQGTARTEPVALCPLALTYLRGGLIPEDVMVKVPFTRTDDGYVGDIRSRAMEEWIDDNLIG